MHFTSIKLTTNGVIDQTCGTEFKGNKFQLFACVYFGDLPTNWEVAAMECECPCIPIIRYKNLV